MNWRLLLGLIGLALFAWMVHQVPASAWRAPTQPGWIAGALILSFAMVGLSALRWQILNHAHAHPLGFCEAYRQFLLGLGLGFLTPGRLGDLSRAWMGRTEHEHSRAVRLSLVLQERLVDVALMLALSLWGLWQLQLWGHGTLAVLIVAAGLCTALVGAYLASRWLRRHPGHLAAFLGAFAQMWRQPRVMLWVAILSALIWGLRILQLQLLVFAMGQPLTFSLAAGMLAVSLLAGLVTLIPLGLGAQDLSLSLFFETASYPPGFGSLVAALYRAFVNVPLIGAAALVYVSGKGPTSRTRRPSPRRRSR